MEHFTWTPGIGDPSVLGWVTVALYLITSFWCYGLVRGLGDRHGHRRERHVWTGLALLFLALGINKQLDLQSAVTDLGRVILFEVGLYESRRVFQVIFFGAVAIAGTVGAISIAVWFRRTHWACQLAVAGCVAVLAFVVLRAASFHKMDVFIDGRVLGLRWNWILEIGGILSVAGANRLRRRALADGDGRRAQSSESNVS